MWKAVSVSSDVVDSFQSPLCFIKTYGSNKGTGLFFPVVGNNVPVSCFQLFTQQPLLVCFLDLTKNPYFPDRPYETRWQPPAGGRVDVQPRGTETEGGEGGGHRVQAKLKNRKVGEMLMELFIPEYGNTRTRPLPPPCPALPRSAPLAPPPLYSLFHRHRRLSTAVSDCDPNPQSVPCVIYKELTPNDRENSVQRN